MPDQSGGYTTPVMTALNQKVVVEGVEALSPTNGGGEVEVHRDCTMNV